MSRAALDGAKQNWPILFGQMDARQSPCKNVGDHLNAAGQRNESASLCIVVKVESSFLDGICGSQELNF